MAQKQKLGLGLSIVLHLGFLWVVSGSLPTTERAHDSEPLELTLFELAEPSSAKQPQRNQKTQSRQAKPKQSRSKKNRRHRRKVLNSLKPSLYESQYSPSTDQSDANNPSSGDWSDKPVLSTLNGLGLSEYSENFHFFEILSRKINKGIGYPEDYARNKLTGEFWIKILVDKKGRLLQIIESSKKNPVLCSYVMVNLYQILKTPLPQKHWYSKEKSLAFLLRFDFKVSSIPSVASQQSVRYQKNKMDFLRLAKIPNFIDEVARDYARYLPPIAPTPVGPVINFVQVYRMIRAWQELNPVQRKRMKLELTKERMESLLRIEEERHRSPQKKGL